MSIIRRISLLDRASRFWNRLIQSSVFISSSTLICPISSVSCLSIWGIRSERPFFVAVSLSLACFSRILAILSSIVPYFSTMVFRLAAISAWSILIPKSVACSLVIFPAFRASSTHLRNSSYLSFMPLMRRSSSESVSSVICLYILSSSWAYFSSMAARSSAFFCWIFDCLSWKYFVWSAVMIPPCAALSFDLSCSSLFISSFVRKSISASSFCLPSFKISMRDCWRALSLARIRSDSFFWALAASVTVLPETLYCLIFESYSAILAISSFHFAVPFNETSIASRAASASFFCPSQ